MPGALFKKWLKPLSTSQPSIALYGERDGARSIGLSVLKGLLAEHFVGEATILKAGGYAKAASIIMNSLPGRK
jgi:hypothetical protein